jgi:hypothetical protein
MLLSSYMRGSSKGDELTPVDEKDAPLGKYADKVLEWAKQPSI